MKNAALLVLLIIITSTSNALNQTNCNLHRLDDYALFTIADSSVQYSDVEGITGALASFSALNFAFGEKLVPSCPSLVVNKSFYGAYGKAFNFIAAPNKSIDIQVKRSPYPSFTLGPLQIYPSLDLNFVVYQINELSHKLSLLDTKSVRVKLQNQNLELSLSPALKINAVTLSELSFLENGSINIQGNSNQIIVINFLAPRVQFKKLSINVRGLKIKNIIWNFMNATELQLSNIGGKNSLYTDSQDGSVGLQGYVLAPLATVQAEEMKITGGLYVNALVALGEKATAQINLPPDQDYNNPCMQPELQNCSANSPVTAPAPPLAPKPQ